MTEAEKQLTDHPRRQIRHRLRGTPPEAAESEPEKAHPRNRTLEGLAWEQRREQAEQQAPRQRYAGEWKTP